MIYAPSNAYPDPPRRGTQARLGPLKRGRPGSSVTSSTCGAILFFYFRFLLLGNRDCGTWPRSLPFLCHYWIPKGDGYKREAPVTSGGILKRETSAIFDLCGIFFFRDVQSESLFLTLVRPILSPAPSTSFIRSFLSSSILSPLIIRHLFDPQSKVGIYAYVDLDPICLSNRTRRRHCSSPTGPSSSGNKCQTKERRV